MDPDSTLNAGAAVADTGHWTLALARRPKVGVRRGPSAQGLRLSASERREREIFESVGKKLIESI
eukprot:scaffold5737_cov112-Isochrysis_galbana.AAC.2